MENITYKKIDDNNVEVTTTTTNSTVSVLNLNDLNYSRESLVKTIDNNLQDVTDRNAVIQKMIDDLDVKIANFKSLGVVEVVIPPVEEVTP